MKLWILCCVVAAAAARPADQTPVEIVYKDFYKPGDGKGFTTIFKQSDGTSVQAKGEVVKITKDGKDVEALIITGRYSFFVDGVKYTVKYTADQNGYHPEIFEETDPPPEVPPKVPPVVLDRREDFTMNVQKNEKPSVNGVSSEVVRCLLGCG